MMRWGLLICFFAAAALFAADDMVVTGSRLNIRKTPSVKGAVVGSVKKGDIVRVRRVKNGWAELEGRPGFVSADYLRKPDPPGNPPAPPRKPPKAEPRRERPAEHGKVAPAGPSGSVLGNLPVDKGSKRDVTVRGRLHPIRNMGQVRYALLRAVGGKYVPQCYIYVPAKDVRKYKEFSGTDVQLVGYWYKVPGWKNPVMQVRRIRGL